jgi:hypothetical protein
VSKFGADKGLLRRWTQDLERDDIKSGQYLPKVSVRDAVTESWKSYAERCRVCVVMSDWSELLT